MTSTPFHAKPLSVSPKTASPPLAPNNPISGKTIWISDLHLGYRDCKAQYLLNFLDQIHCETLYLVGDVVDFWALSKRLWWPPEHYQVMLKLYELAGRGIRVIYVPGNHDEPIRHFAGELFGPIEVRLEHEYLGADGKRWLIMHGDAMDAYINLNWITRFGGDLAYGALLMLNRWSNRFRRWCGRPYFSLSGLIKSNIGRARQAIETYESEAMDEARRRGFDGVICGHIHAPALFEREGIRYANTGDWIESCTALLEDAQGQMQLLHYSDQLQWQQAQAQAPEPAARAA